MDARLSRILEGLRAARFADVRGARVSVVLPVGERLLNEVVTALVPADAPVRELSVKPKGGNTFAVRGRASRLEFLPPVTLTLQIERQPEPPAGPLVLRITSMPGLISMAGSLLSPNSLPPGIRLERERVLVDLRTLAERHGAGDLLELVERVHLTTDEGRLIVEADLRV